MVTVEDAAREDAVGITSADDRKRWRALSELGAFALGTDDLQAVLDRSVETASHLFNAPLTKVLLFGDHADRLDLVSGLGWQEGLVGHASVGIDLDSQAGFTLIHDGPVIVHDLHDEDRFTGPPLLREHGVRSGISVIIPGIGERPFGVFGIHTRVIAAFDETDAHTLLCLAHIVAASVRQARAQAYRRVVLREAAHRAGNMLQIVGSMASQTFDGQLPEPLESAFRGRLRAMALANGAIVRDGWTVTRLRDIAAETLIAHQSQLAVSGRDIVVKPELAFDLGLVLHELESNSAKYGAFRSDAEIVSLAWASDKRDGSAQLELSWTDPVTSYSEAVSRTGYGTRLIRDLVETKWGGTIETRSGNGEYVFTLRLPIPDDPAQ